MGGYIPERVCEEPLKTIFDKKHGNKFKPKYTTKLDTREYFAHVDLSAVAIQAFDEVLLVALWKAFQDRGSS